MIFDLTVFSVFAHDFQLEFLIVLKFNFKHSVYTRSHFGKSSQDKKTLQLWVLATHCYPLTTLWLNVQKKQIAKSEKKAFLSWKDLHNLHVRVTWRGDETSLEKHPS